MFSSRNLTKQKVSRGIPFVDIATAILGKHYELSLVFIGDRRSQRLNVTYREKNKPTNVLAFPIDKQTGEIFLNVRYSNHEAPKFDHKPEAHLAYLFIHGALHLKGFSHGSIMERKEQELMKRFGFLNGTTHRNRPRHRDQHNQSHRL